MLFIYLHPYPFLRTDHAYENTLYAGLLIFFKSTSTSLFTGGTLN